jgi:hypothetical protein
MYPVPDPKQGLDHWKELLEGVDHNDRPLFFTPLTPPPPPPPDFEKTPPRMIGYTGRKPSKTPHIKSWPPPSPLPEMLPPISFSSTRLDNPLDLIHDPNEYFSLIRWRIHWPTWAMIWSGIALGLFLSEVILYG